MSLGPEDIVLTPTPAAVIGAFHDIARRQLLLFLSQVLWDLHKVHMNHGIWKGRPSPELLTIMSYVAELRDMGHPWHLWRGLVEAERLVQRAKADQSLCLVQRAKADQSLCLVALTAIRSDAIEACRRKL